MDIKMRIILTFIIVTSNLLSNAQIKYEEGYIIDNDNNKINCLIKNLDWKVNPVEVMYKLTEGDSENIKDIVEIKEFKILNSEHYYKRYKLYNSLKDYDLNILNQENTVVLLRVLLESDKATLYEYYNEIPFYFFHLDDDDLEYLEYKKYVDDDNKVRENSNYKKTLFDNLKCEKFTRNTFSKLKYTSTDLVDIFSEYSICRKTDFENYHEQRTKAKFGFKLLLGINNFAKGGVVFSPSYIQRNSIPSGSTIRVETNQEVGLDPKIGVLFGFETELRLPFNRNKWSLYTAPNYQSYSQDRRTVTIEDNFRFQPISYDVTYSIDYSFVEVPIGIRYHMNLNETSKLFAQFAFAFPIHLKKNERETFVVTDDNIVFSNIEVEVSDRNSDQSNLSFIIGAGYNVSDKYSIAFNYYLSKNLKGDEPITLSQNGSFNLLGSYILF